MHRVRDVVQGGRDSVVQTLLAGSLRREVRSNWLGRGFEMENGRARGRCEGAANLIFGSVMMLVVCAIRLVQHLGAHRHRPSTTVTPRVRRRIVIRRVARLLVRGRPKARVVRVRTLAAADYLPAVIQAVPRALSSLEVHARELLLHAGNVMIPPGRDLGIPARIRTLEGSHSPAPTSVSPPRFDNFRQVYCEK